MRKTTPSIPGFRPNSVRKVSIVDFQLVAVAGEQAGQSSPSGTNAAREKDRGGNVERVKAYLHEIGPH